MTRERLLREMSSAELSDWVAFNAVEPIGERATQATIAILSSMFYHANRSKEQPPLSDLDYFMVGDPGASPQPEIDPEAKLRAFKAGLGAVGKRAPRRRK